MISASRASHVVFCCLVLGLTLPLTISEAFAQVRVIAIADPARFDRLTGAAAIPIPDSQRAFPGTNCGSGDRGPTGSGPTVVIPFGANRLTITGASGNGLCIFDGGTMILSVSGGLDNTQPNFMTANTIVGNGDDDFLFTFDYPVYAVGLTLLTNNLARETVTFRGLLGNVIDVINIDRLTPRNDRVFIGFASRVPIKSILLDTADGATQNEGFQSIKVGETLPGDFDAP
jgi:hypothetical protein